MQTFWLGRWSRQYELVADPKSVSVAYYLGIYCLTVLGGTAAMCIGYTIWTIGSVKSGMVIHKRVSVHSVSADEWPS